MTRIERIHKVSVNPSATGLLRGFIGTIRAIRADFVVEMLQAREFVGAFALNGGSADASTLALFDPGSYTMPITAGSGVAAGEALVEIYEVP